MRKPIEEQTVKRLKTKISLFAFGILAALCFALGAGAAAGTYAEETPQGMVQSGKEVRVEYDYALANSRFSPFAYYAGKTAMEGAAGSGIVNSVKQYAAALDSSEKLSGNPMLLETAECGSKANGASISLGCYSNEFSIVANALQTTYANSAAYKTSLYFDSKVYSNGKFNDREPISYGDTSLIDFTSIQFDFIDLNDTSNVFTLRQTQTDKSDSASNYFTYRGKTVERRSWNALTGVHYASAMPILFRFDPTEKTFTMGQRYTKYSINGSAQHGSGGNDGSDFGFAEFAMSEDFEVRVSFYGVMDGVAKDYWRSTSENIPQYERRGRLAVYALDGQPMTGSLADMRPVAEPSLIAMTSQEIYKDVPYALPPLKIYDLIGGVSELGETAALTGPDGKPVGVVGGAFTPETEGVYTVSYSARWNGGEITRDYLLRAVIDTEPPVIELKGEYAERYLEGTRVKILDCEVKDNSGSIRSSSVRVFCGEEDITDLVSDGCLTAEAGKTYTAVYEATDYTGLKADPVKKEFGVYAFSVSTEKEVELSPKAQFLPQPDLLGDAVFTVCVYDAKDTSLSMPLAENVTSFLFPHAGEYLLCYTVSGLGENEYQKTVVKSYRVVDTTPPVITLNKRYEKKYAAGQTVAIIGASVADNSGADLTYRVTVSRGGRELKFSENTLKLKQSGEYTLTYTATDASGNTGSAVVTFMVEGGGNAAWVWILISAAIAFAVVAGIVSIFVIRSKKMKNKDAEGNGHDD